MEGYTNPEATREQEALQDDIFMPEVTAQKPEPGLFDEPEGGQSGEAELAEPEADEDTPDDFFSQPDDTIRVKYNGKTLRLTREEAAVLAQKGMNYDKVCAERDRLRRGEDVRRLDELARAEGMNREAYLNKLMQESRERRLIKATEQVKKRYPGIPEDAAKALAEANLYRAEQEKSRPDGASQEAGETEKAGQGIESDGAAARGTPSPQDAWDEGYWKREIAPWHAFLRRYPDMNSIERIPAAVLADVERGASPLEAMLSFELEEAKAEIGRLRDELERGKKAEKNRKKAMSPQESGGELQEADLFLQGLGF